MRYPADVDDRSSPRANAESPPEDEPSDLELVQSLFGEIADEVRRTLPGQARRLGSSALRAGLSWLKPVHLERAAEAGRIVEDARKVAGLTLADLAEATGRDPQEIDAVEKGTSTVSFELLLRLASLLARHDPVPFLMKYLRTSDPAVVQFLEDWGLGRLPVTYERERRFLNILRRRDEARALGDDSFERLVAFTEQAFHLALQELSPRDREIAAREAEIDKERAQLNSERATLEAERVLLDAARAGVDAERRAIEAARADLLVERAPEADHAPFRAEPPTADDQGTETTTSP